MPTCEQHKRTDGLVIDCLCYPSHCCECEHPVEPYHRTHSACLRQVAKFGEKVECCACTQHDCEAGPEFSKNAVSLKSFQEYCLANPDQRFWQQIRNFSGYRFIYGQKLGDLIAEAEDAEGRPVALEDTFYLE